MSSNGKSLTPLETPDALGPRGRAVLVANLLRNVQEKRFTLELEVVANDLGEDSCSISGAPPTYTVGQWRAALQEVEDRVLVTFADLMPRVRELINAEVQNGQQ